MFRINLVIFLCVYLQCFSAIEIETVPCAAAFTPNSILNNTSTVTQYFAGDRPRYSTCTGVCWLNQNHTLFVANYLTHSVQIYSFDTECQTLRPHHTSGNADRMDLFCPENLALSMKGDKLVIPNMGHGKIQIYQMVTSDCFNPRPVMTIHGIAAHGARFSRDDRFLAYASREFPGVTIYSLVPTLSKTQSLGMPYAPYRAKSIDFSLDGRFMVVGYCERLSINPNNQGGVIAVYSFDSHTGRVNPEPVCHIDSIISVETVCFHPNGTAFFSVDQINECIMGHAFDCKTGEITSTWVALGGAESQLSFPHGIDFSSDGKYLAVSNYGDDKVTIHRVNNFDQQ